MVYVREPLVGGKLENVATPEALVVRFVAGPVLWVTVTVAPLIGFVAPPRPYTVAWIAPVRGAVTVVLTVGAVPPVPSASVTNPEPVVKPVGAAVMVTV